MQNAEEESVSEQPGDQAALPKRVVPITSREDLETEMPAIISAALQEISDDKFHALPTSKFGQTMMKIARQLLLVNLACLCAFMVNFCVPILASSQLDTMQLRTNADFIEGFLDVILTNMELELRFAIQTVRSAFSIFLLHA